MAETFKYLAIKNWKKYQSSKKGYDWIKDYVNQNDDKELSGLSFFERGLLQELRRLRGRSGKNIHNDVTHIAQAIHAKGTDRPHIRHAIATLVARDVLVLTNQSVDPLEEIREEEKRGEERHSGEKIKPSASEDKKEPIEMDRHSAATGLGAMIGMSSAGFNLSILVSAIDQGKRRWPEVKHEDIAQRICALWKEYIAQPTHAKQSLKNWLDSVGRFIDSDDWKVKKTEEFKPQIDWQGGHVGGDGVYVNKAGKRMPGYQCPPQPKAAHA